MSIIEWLNSDEGFEWSKSAHEQKPFVLILKDDAENAEEWWNADDMCIILPC